MTTINYISNLDVNEFSGGWSAMNHHIYHELNKRFSVHLCDRINPSYPVIDKIESKLLRSIGLKGTFPAFSLTRLNKIATIVERCINKNASINFYHGATPWLMVKNHRPYSLYLDCCFATYLNVYHQPAIFIKNQINDLYRRETNFLKNAQHVFFSSQWAVDDCRRWYKLAGENFIVAGLGGAMDFSDVRSNSKDKYFLFAGLDYIGKGGDVLVDSMREVRKQYPTYSLKIIGAQPPSNSADVDGVEFVGRLDKSNENDLAKLKSLFANAFCFVLPTKKDMTPLVLVEALSAGVPVISTNSFGIPEIVSDGEDGILLKAAEPLKPQLIEAMINFIDNPSIRDRLADNAKRQQSRFNWEAVGEVISGKIAEPSTQWQKA